MPHMHSEYELADNFKTPKKAAAWVKKSLKETILCNSNIRQEKKDQMMEEL